MAQLSEAEELELLELERQRANSEQPALPTVGAESIGAGTMAGMSAPGLSTGEQRSKRLKAFGGQFFTPDEEARADILREIYPDVEFAQGEDGHMVARVDPEGKFVRLHTPGVNFANDIIRFIPAAKVGSLGAGILSRMGLAGAAGAATGYGSEKAAQALGSEQRTDAKRIAIEGAGMAAGEAIAPVVAGAGRAAIRGGRRLLGGKSAGEQAAERVAQLEGRRAVEATKPNLTGAMKEDVFIDPQSVPGGVVYHTTTKRNLERMMKEGFSPQPAEGRTFDATPDDYIFFASRDAAPFWRKRISERAPEGDELVTLEIPVDDLEQGKMLIDREGFDWGRFGPDRLPNQAARTFQYSGQITPEALAQARIVPQKEMAEMALGVSPKESYVGKTSSLNEARRTGGSIGTDDVRALPSEGPVPQRLKNADAAAMTRMAREMGIPLTKGQATRDMGQMALEDSFRRGGRGQGAQRVMSDFDELQARQFKAGADKLNPNYVAEDLNEAGNVIGQTLKAGGERQNRAANQAFKRLERINETLPAESVQRLAQDMRAAVPTGLRDPGRLVGDATLKENFKESSRILEDVERIAAEMANTPDAPVKFRELMELRGSIALAQKGAVRGDRAALPAMKSALEDFVIREATDQLANGAEIAQLFKDAPKAKALWGGLYTSRGKDDIAGKVIEQIVNQDLTGEKIANILVNGAESAGNRTTYATAKRMKEIAAVNAGLKGKKYDAAQLAAQAPEFQALRDAMMYNTFRKGFPTGSAENFKPQTLATHLDKLLDGPGKSVMEELFTQKELMQMRNYRSVLKQTIPPKNATNPSGSGDRMWANFLDMMPLLSNVKAASGIRNTARAKAATGGISERLPQGAFTTAGKSIGAAFVENPEGAQVVTRKLEEALARTPRSF